MELNGEKKLSRYIALCLIVVFAAGMNITAVCASDWCFVASSNKYYYYIDSESISIFGKNVTFWIVQQDIESGRVFYKKQFTINCEDETVMLRDSVKAGFSGMLREMFSDERYGEWADIRPRSKMHEVQNILCCDSRPRKNIAEYL